VATVVGRYVGAPQALLKLHGVGRAKRHKPAQRRYGDFGRQLESLDEKRDLPLAERPQSFHREPLLLEELEHRRPSVMARKVIRRPRKPRRPRSILLPSTRRLGQIRKLAEPPSKYRTESRVGREPQKCIARPQPAV